MNRLLPFTPMELKALSFAIPYALQATNLNKLLADTLQILGQEIINETLKREAAYDAEMCFRVVPCAEAHGHMGTRKPIYGIRYPGERGWTPFSSQDQAEMEQIGKALNSAYKLGKDQAEYDKR